MKAGSEGGVDDRTMDLEQSRGTETDGYEESV